MKYRFANEKDYDFIKKHDKHLPKNLILLKINNNEIIFVEQDNEIVGWLRFGFFWDNIPFINMLWIDELYRGKGIGGGVIRFWEDEPLEIFLVKNLG